jgi:hypothetical protein
MRAADSGIKPVALHPSQWSSRSIPSARNTARWVQSLTSLMRIREPNVTGFRLDKPCASRERNSASSSLKFSSACYQRAFSKIRPCCHYIQPFHDLRDGQLTITADGWLQTTNRSLLPSRRCPCTVGEFCPTRVPADDEGTPDDPNKALYDQTRTFVNVRCPSSRLSFVQHRCV